MNTSSSPYGLWPSPMTPSSLAQDKRLSDVAWDTASDALVWLEVCSGFGMLVKSAPGEAPRDLNPGLSARARVGYGGGDMTVSDGHVFFVSEGRLYRQPLEPGAAVAITPAFGELAAPSVSPDGKWVLFIHSDQGQDCLAVVDRDGQQWPQRLAFGCDFYMQPTWHPDGRRIAWVSWRHPNMPWDGTQLTLATLQWHDKALPWVAEEEELAGDAETAIFQPAFSPDGRFLSYISDAGGWSQIYVYDLVARASRLLTSDEAEWGQVAWAQGIRTHCWAPDSRTIYACRNHQAVTTLWRIDVETGEKAPVPLGEEYAWVDQPAISQRGELALIASGPRTPKRIVTMVDEPLPRPRCIARSASENIPSEALVCPRPMQWLAEDGQSVYGLLYAPHPQRPPSEERPPLVVLVHGGPTGQATSGYSPQAQFLATRGYAVLDLSYRGSAGYGRHYRNLLRGQWGVYDAADAVAGARHVCQQGLADADRLVIMGGSAGGYTVLQALILYPHVFKAGLCLYGVTNLFSLAADTHKFEQHYLDTLIGPLPACAQRYRDRSPIFHADRIVDPVAIFQGDEDRVVPPGQAETIVQELRHNGVPHIYRLYAGEGHGWRKAETIATFYEDVLQFLRQYVIFA